MFPTRARLFVGGLIVFSSTAFFLGGSAVQAQTPLPIDSTVPVVSSVFFGGTQLSSVSSLFAGTASNGQAISGTLLSAVYSGGTGAAGLDFYYQFTVDSTSTQDIGNISLSSWAGAATLVSQTTQDIDGAGAFRAGGTASSTARRNSGGSGIQFNFETSSVAVGASSTTLIVRTDVSVFTPQGSAALLGSAGVSANTSGDVLAPTAAGATVAPEPSALALLVPALALVGLARRRKTGA